MAFAALASIGLSSCKEGQYWDEESNPGEIYAFAKTSVFISLTSQDEFPESYDVTISRNIAGEAVTIPVEFESNSPLITGPSSVTFEAGKFEASYTISIADGCSIGQEYDAQILLEQPEDTNLIVSEDNLAFTFAMMKDWTWVSAGTAVVAESLFGGYAEDVPVEIASDFENANDYKLYRLVAPYKAMLDPDNEDDEVMETNLLYVLDENEVPVSMYYNFQSTGVIYNGDLFYFGIVPDFDCSFTNSGPVYLMDGIVAIEANGGLSAQYYEAIQFLWSDYGK